MTGEHMDTRDRITYEAFTIFLDKGYKSATYAELMKAANMSKGAFYHYFKNKEELFARVIDRYFVTVFEKVPWDDLAGRSADELRIALRNYYRGFIREIDRLTDKGLARYFILFFEAVEIYPAFAGKAREFYRRVMSLLEEGTGDRRAAVDEIARYEGYLFWLALFPGEDPEDIFG